MPVRVVPLELNKLTISSPPPFFNLTSHLTNTSSTPSTSSVSHRGSAGQGPRIHRNETIIGTACKFRRGWHTTVFTKGRGRTEALFPTPLTFTSHSFFSLRHLSYLFTFHLFIIYLFTFALILAGALCFFMLFPFDFFVCFCLHDFLLEIAFRNRLE